MNEIKTGIAKGYILAQLDTSYKALIGNGFSNEEALCIFKECFETFTNDTKNKEETKC